MELPAVSGPKTDIPGNVFDQQQRDTMREFMACGMLKLEKVMKNQLVEISPKLQ